MWTNWTAFQKTFFCIALLFSLILVVQLILMIIGIGQDGDADVDLDGDGDGDIFGLDGDMPIFTVRGVIAFFAVGGWTGFALGDGTLHEAWAAVIAFAAGSVALVAVGFMLRWIVSLASNGNMDINNAVGKTGEVYLTVPACGNGAGKITVEVQGALKELEAVTESSSPIKTGARVTICKVTDGMCVVEQLAP